ncbi:MAG: methionyl-tRNA formyltransferase, partial [Burkholderiaceae bacterium]
TVLQADARGIDVACGAGVLRLTELQRAGGKRLDVAAFLRGFALPPGLQFGRKCDLA